MKLIEVTQKESPIEMLKRKKREESEAIAKVYRDHCSDWDIENKPLWRRIYFDSAKPSSLISSTGAKKSGNPGLELGSIKLEAWLDTLPEWQKYPSRLASVFCSTSSTNIRIGEKTDELYCVVPFNGTKLASVYGDFNFIKVNTEHGKMELSDIERTVYRLAKQPRDSQKTFKDCLEILGETEKYRNLLSPKSLRVELSSTTNFNPGKRMKEVWFEGKYLIFESFKYHDVVSLTKESK